MNIAMILKESKNPSSLIAELLPLTLYISNSLTMEISYSCVLKHKSPCVSKYFKTLGVSYESHLLWYFVPECSVPECISSLTYVLCHLRGEVRVEKLIRIRQNTKLVFCHVRMKLGNAWPSVLIFQHFINTNYECTHFWHLNKMFHERL